MAADARHGAAALRNLRRGVVRAAGAEVGQAARHDARPGEGLVLGFQVSDALVITRSHSLVEPELRQAARERPGDQRGRQLVMRGQQPVARRLAFGDRPLAVVVELADDARRAHAFAPVVQLFLDLVFDDLALFLDHEDLFEPFGELARPLRLERPGHRHLVETDAGLRGDALVDAEVGEGLQGVAEGFAGGDDAEACPRAVPDDAVEPVRPAIGERRIDLVVEQTRLLLEKSVRPADVEAARRHGEVGRHDDLHALRIDLHHGARLDHVGHALECHPAAGETRHGEPVQAEIEIFLDARGVEHRDAAGLEDVLALVRQGRGFRRVIVACEDEHAAVSGRARRVGVLEDVAAAVHPGTLAVPDGEHAVVFRVRVQVDLLRAPDRGRGEVFVDAGLEFDVVLVEELLRLPQRLVEAAERRAAIAGNESGGVQARGEIADPLQHRQAHQGLRTGHEGAPAIQRVLIVERNFVNLGGGVHVSSFSPPRFDRTGPRRVHAASQRSSAALVSAGRSIVER